MADMSKIVGAVIAITVRGSLVKAITGKCDCNCFRPRTHHCRIHRNQRST